MRCRTALFVGLLAFALSGCAFIVTEHSSEEHHGNERPELSLAIQPNPPEVGESVMLDASGSTDPDADSLTYHFLVRDERGDAVHVSSGEGWSTSFRAERPVEYHVKLTVVDEHGAESRITTTVTPHDVNTAPRVEGSWELYVDGNRVARGEGSGGLRATDGRFDRLVMRVDEIRDPEGDDTSVRWVLDSTPEGYSEGCEACGGMQFTLQLTELGVYEGRAVVRDEHGASAELPFHVEKVE